MTLSVWSTSVEGGSAPRDTASGTRVRTEAATDPPLWLKIRSDAKPKAIRRSIAGPLRLDSLSGWRSRPRTVHTGTLNRQEKIRMNIGFNDIHS